MLGQRLAQSKTKIKKKKKKSKIQSSTHCAFWGQKNSSSQSFKISGNHHSIIKRQRQLNKTTTKNKSRTPVIFVWFWNTLKDKSKHAPPPDVTHIQLYFACMWVSAQPSTKVPGHWEWTPELTTEWGKKWPFEINSTLILRRLGGFQTALNSQPRFHHIVRLSCV